MIGSNYTAPLPQFNSGVGPKNIIDIATGSGIWVVELARESSRAQVVGIDLCKPGFFGREVPENASFIGTDVTKRLPFEDASFDVVQMRIVPNIAERMSIYQEVHRMLRPRGIIQLVEVQLIASRKGARPPVLKEINKAVAQGGFMYQNGNKPPLDENRKPEFGSIASQIAPALRAAPSMWANVHEKQIRVPVGVWTSDEVGREAGRLMKRQTVEVYQGFRLNIIDAGG
ncbi:S-adenosyl-L-methionine-dependent methyltransferase [Rhizoctonia solani]|nr:S-adenosyl-L-methionine-dependent methyltransferase [Rhizoctonia solani]